MVKEKLSKNDYNTINEVESWLYNYKSIQVAIINLQGEYNILDELTIGSISYDNEGGKSNKFNSTVENQLSKKINLNQKIANMTNKIEQLNRAMEVLTDTEHKVIKNFYIDGRRYYEFTHEVGFGERTCKRIKNKALEKIIIGINGIE